MNLTKYVPINRISVLLLLALALLLFSEPQYEVYGMEAGDYQQENIHPSDIGAFDEFGFSADITSRFAVIGAPYHDVLNGSQKISDAGAAYIYELKGGIWQLNKKIFAPTPQANANFGISVSIDGETIAIGAVGYDSATEKDVGAVHIFSYSDGGWEWEQRIVSEVDEEGESFGNALHLNGKLLVVGASGSDTSGRTDGGAAYVFIGGTGTWYKQAALISDSPQPDAAYGHAVNTDGTRIVVGSPGENDSGRAYIYEQDSTGWSTSGVLGPSDGRNGDFFGSAVALDDNLAVVGASLKDPLIENERINNGGGVYVYRLSGSLWKEESTIELNDTEAFDTFGNSLDLNGRTLVVGAEGKNNFGVISSGRAYLYDRSGTAWSLIDFVYPEPSYKYDYFGQAVVTNGDDILIGAIGRDPGNLTRAGEAFIYNYDLLLPETGFAPNQNHIPHEQPEYLAYAETSLSLSIPSIDVALPIVSVPQTLLGWDTTWLNNQVGYLESTSFPTLPGNTVLTGHVWDANNNPGPFTDLRQLQHGDEIIISAWGMTYTYEVRTSFLVQPTDLNVLGEKDLDWITLITCADYSESSGDYLYRRAIQAILIDVK